jgi:PIN domain nuclease of toxin-antitoxin system
LRGYLLDTHIFLWWLEDSDRLKKDLKDIIADSKNEIYISSVSIWEIAIKSSLGKLDIEASLDDIIGRCGFKELKISAKCAVGIKNLPRHHNDPFDRMLISQAINHNLVLISVDRYIKKYDEVRVIS